jgi:hypothetical protein
VDRLQALLDGQSLDFSQPHARPARQAWPLLLEVQSRQATPVPPQVAGAVPATHLLPEQQPPLQTVWLASPQVCSQTCVERVQDVLFGQSDAVLHPHLPELVRQTWPVEAAVQSAQTPE